MSEQVEIAPVDLHLRAQPVQRDGRLVLHFDLSSPSGRVDQFRVIADSRNLPSEPAPYQDLLDELEHLLRGRRDDARLTAKEVEDRLRRLGKGLYRHLLPREIHEALDTAPPDSSLLVESDEQWIPWELLHTHGKGGDFLCLQFRMGRWLTGPVAPAHRIGIQTILCVDAGSLNASNRRMPPKLPQSVDEAEVLADIARRRDLGRVPLDGPRFDEVLDRLQRGGFELFHFIGHGDFPANHGADRAKLLLEQQNLAPTDLVDEVETAFKTARPFVFLNACRTARQGESLVGLGGWPRQFVKTCRSGAFLAPQWSVRSARAHWFARDVYASLEAGQPLGEAIRRARRPPATSEEQAILGKRRYLDATSLAYAFYGHPNAVVVWGDVAVNKPSKGNASKANKSPGTEPWPPGLEKPPPGLPALNDSRAATSLVLLFVLVSALGGGLALPNLVSPLTVAPWTGAQTLPLPPLSPHAPQSGATYEVYLVLPSFLEGATILIDGKPPKILKNSGTFVLIEVPEKDGNHRIEISHGHRVCPPLELSIGPETRRIPISC